MAALPCPLHNSLDCAALNRCRIRPALAHYPRDLVDAAIAAVAENMSNPAASLSTCECAVGQIKPAWDRSGRLVCEDCYGRIARARKMSGQNARPGEAS